jgi:hypothetical protein
MVCLLTLTSGPGSWVTMVSEPGSPLLGVGSAVIFFILAADPDVLEPIKQHLKNHKNTNNSYLDIQYFVFTPHGNYIIILIT